MKAITNDTFFPVLSSEGSGDQNGVKAAYAQVYSNMDTKNAEGRGQDKRKDVKKFWLKEMYKVEIDDNALNNLVNAQKAETEASLSRNKRTVRDNTEQSKTRAGDWIASRISQITKDIEIFSSSSRARRRVLRLLRRRCCRL